MQTVERYCVECRAYKDPFFFRTALPPRSQRERCKECITKGTCSRGCGRPRGPSSRYCRECRNQAQSDSRVPEPYAASTCDECGETKPGADFRRTAPRRGEIVRCRACLAKGTCARACGRPRLPTHRYCTECKRECDRRCWARHGGYKGLYEVARFKANARSTLHVNVKRGKVQKPERCACGGTPVHAFFRDYNHPLEVDWLCPPCHRVHSAERRRPGA